MAIRELAKKTGLFSALSFVGITKGTALFLFLRALKK